MITYCKTCRTLVTTPGDGSLFNLEEWESTVPCITGLCGGRAIRVSLEDAGNLDVTRTKEYLDDAYYGMLCGLGTTNPPAPTSKVVALLKTQRIVEVTAWPKGNPERTIIDSVKLEDGTVLHFAPSVYGACVFNIEEGPK